MKYEPIPQGKRVFDEMSVLDNFDIGGFNLPKKLLKERIEIILQTFPTFSREEREGTRSTRPHRFHSLKLKVFNLRHQHYQRNQRFRQFFFIIHHSSFIIHSPSFHPLYTLLVEINREFNIAMLIVEQKVMEVLDISHRVYSIKLGRVAFEGLPGELKDNKQKIKELFL